MRAKVTLKKHLRVEHRFRFEIEYSFVFLCSFRSSGSNVCSTNKPSTYPNTQPLQFDSQSTPYPPPSCLRFAMRPCSPPPREVYQFTWHSSSCSRMYLPSLYFSALSYALSYFQPHNFSTLFTGDVSYHMAASGHVTLAGLTLLNVDDGVEEIGFAVLTAEVLHNLQQTTHIS